MNIVFICTNYNSIKCGIGMFTYNLAHHLSKEKDVNIEIISSNTFHLKGLKKIFSLKLIKEILKFIKKNENKRLYPIEFIIEYPFMDWNPLTILALVYLKIYFKNSKLLLSIHEYYRVHILRRKLIDVLINLSDGYIVTDKNLYDKIKSKKKLLRSIPSNILKINFDTIIERSEENYCYFGLVNKSKAFNEMIEAWKKFNIDNSKNLNIYTSSDIEIMEKEKYNIKIYKDLSNKDLSIELQKNTFMILPIIPYLDLNNGTLKAAAEHECIPIGIFSKEVKFLGINIMDKLYSARNIEEALKSTINLKKDKFLKELKIFSNSFSFEKNSKDIYKFLNSKNWRDI